jgi:hypothetical protein
MGFELLRPFRRRVIPLAMLVFAFAFAGCAAGPDFKPPAPPTAKGYLSHPPGATVTAADVAGAMRKRSRLARIFRGIGGRCSIRPH